MAVPDSLLPATLAAVPAETVAAYDAVVAAMAAEFAPGVDTTRGAVRDLVLGPAAALAAASRGAVDAVWDALVPDAAANADVVDRVAAVYRVARRAAGTATGEVAVVLATAVETVLPAGLAVTVGTQAFVVSTAVTARTAAAAVVTAADRLLVAVPDGWMFSAPVTAVEAGAAGNVRAGTAAVFAAAVPGFVRAYAAVGATGGADAESNQSVVDRLAVGLAGRGWSTRAGVSGLLADGLAAAGVRGASVIGFGDAEMLRDRRTPWPVGTGGRTDVYVWAAPGVETVVVATTGVLVSKVGSVGTWRASLGREAAAGLVRVAAVRTTAGGTDLPVAVTPGYDAAAAAVDATDVRSGQEAAYSAYQTAVFTFTDPQDATALPLATTTATYYAVVDRVPAVAAAQAFLGARDRRPPAGDVCVKGAVPVECSVAVTLKVPAGAAADVAAVAAAVAAAVNDLGFTLTVPAAVVTAAVRDATPAGTSVTAVDLFLSARRPDGATVTARDSTAVSLPADAAAGLTARTAAVWCDAADVAVTVV